jgi:hypothetical protein
LKQDCPTPDYLKAAGLKETAETGTTSSTPTTTLHSTSASTTPSKTPANDNPIKTLVEDENSADPEETDHDVDEEESDVEVNVVDSSLVDSTEDRWIAESDIERRKKPVSHKKKKKKAKSNDLALTVTRTVTTGTGLVTITTTMSITSVKNEKHASGICSTFVVCNPSQFTCPAQITNLPQIARVVESIMAGQSIFGSGGVGKRGRTANGAFIDVEEPKAGIVGDGTQMVGGFAGFGPGGIFEKALGLSNRNGTTTGSASTSTMSLSTTTITITKIEPATVAAIQRHQKIALSSMSPPKIGSFGLLISCLAISFIFML